MLEPGIAIVERDAAVESLMDLDFGSGETEAAGLRMNLQPAAVPLHNIIVADDAFMSEATDALEVFRSRAPSVGRVAGSASEAAVVVSDKASQDAVGRIQIASLGQAEFAGEAILKHSPKAFDAAFGLRALGGDEGDGELLEGATELSGLALAGELFVKRPVIVVASEDATAIAVEGDGDAVAAQEALEQAEIALGGFRGEELSGENFARSVVLHAQCGELQAAPLQPVVRGAVELHKLAFAARAQAALAMSGRPAFAGRSDAAGAEQSPQSFAAQREAFFFDELLLEMMIVEAGVARARQFQGALAYGLRRAPGTGAAPADVSQSRCAALPIARFEPFDMPRR